jgi:acetamidase/formamidase
VHRQRWLPACFVLLLAGCGGKAPEETAAAAPARPDFVLTRDQTHDKFSRLLELAVRVPSGSVIEALTHEATGGQIQPGSNAEILHTVDMDRVHTLTGPVYVEGAEPGDVLAVRLIELEPADWGWMAVTPDFGFLAGELDATVLQTFKLDTAKNEVEFADGIRIPLRPFAGVMGVAPDTDEMLNTIPPRANGGNLDDPNLVAGTTVYFPVFVEGGRSRSATPTPCRVTAKCQAPPWNRRCASCTRSA